VATTSPFGPVQKVVLAKVASLHPWSRNPRTITAARLADLQRDLEADPQMLWARPLVARLDGTVLMGNQRLAAAVALGWQTIPVAYVDVDDETATLRGLRDNVPYGDWGGWPFIQFQLAEGGMDVAVHPDAPSEFHPIHTDDIVAMVRDLETLPSISKLTALLATVG